MENTQDEKIYFEEGDIKITNRRAILGNKTYVLKNISSVTTHTIQHEAEIDPNVSSGLGCGGMLAFVGLFALFGAIADGGSPDGAAVISLSMLVGGGAWMYSAWQKKGKLKPARVEYSVRIGSNAGDTDGLISSDKEYITRIVNAINDAIIGD